MKCTIPEISWHNREPILSVDLFPEPESTSFYRLASAGGDSHVLIWHINVDEDGSVNQDVVADLKRHQRSVNVVKWSHDGVYLASGDDDASIILWQSKTDNIPSLDDETNDKEKYVVFKVLRGHKEDIYDLCWSPNCMKLLSGSIDNTAIIWDVQKGKSEQIMTDHKGFVQGVAWDPKGQYITTISTDRTCRIYDNCGKQVKSRINKGTLPVPTDHSLHQKEVKYFHDDTFKSFFRRLCFSPDGSILITPSGHIVPEENTKNVLNCTYVFAVETNTPSAILPLRKECSTVAKCCPIFFELREQGPKPYINLPYRIIFAVGTDHDLILYDTQQLAPFARYHNIHYTRLTDITWSNDGLLLIASSTDGYCTLITFAPDELGTQYIKEETEVEETLNASTTVEVMEVIEIPDTNEVAEEKTPQKPTTNTPKRIRNKSILSFFKKADGSSTKTQCEEIVEIENPPKQPKEEKNSNEKSGEKHSNPANSPSITSFFKKTGELSNEMQCEEIVDIKNPHKQPEEGKNGECEEIIEIKDSPTKSKEENNSNEKCNEKPSNPVNSPSILSFFKKIHESNENKAKNHVKKISEEVIEIDDDEKLPSTKVQPPVLREENDIKSANNGNENSLQDKKDTLKTNERKTKLTESSLNEERVKPPEKKPKRITPLRIA